MSKEDTQEQLQRLQLIEQNAQQLLMQKHQFKSQLNEIESALTELENTPEAYKIVGNIMVKTTQQALKKELSEKKEMVELRISTLEKQEQQLREKAESLRKIVVGKLEEK
ncbi:prefoldin subunit beta [Candidatus Woesearchaeota archaeon]|nr:prefoldin subunit beta [Candidatus Woesearchaeota archaeon]